MNKLPLPSSQCVAWCWPWSSLCWSCFNFQSPWILSRVFLRVLILFLQPYHIVHLHYPVVGFFIFFLDRYWLLFFCFFFHDVFKSFLRCPYPILSIILLYNKEAVSRRLCSLSASASCVAVTDADTALYNFEIAFLKNVFIVLLIHFCFFKFYGQEKTIRCLHQATSTYYFHNFSVSFFSSADIHQSQYLDGCQAMGRSSSFIMAFWAFFFFNYLTTLKNWLHHHNHDIHCQHTTCVTNHL